ncbi:MAG: hypothetical protein H0U70_05475 [Tatlockia sp.]|nr:hypothetical protein [Tatlockia sp.]
MLHLNLEKEKEQNYPTVRAILSYFYGDEFNKAEIEAVSGGLLSFGFMVTLVNDQAFFFKIEREDPPLTSIIKSRQKAVYAFMGFMHDKHALDSNYPNSAKCIATLNGEESPVLPIQVGDVLIPSDLVNHQISLVTKLIGKDFSMKEAGLNQKNPANPFNLTNYPKEVPLAMVDCIIDVQKAGEDFCQLYPDYLADLNGQGMRATPRHFLEVMKDLNTVKQLSLPELQKTIDQLIHQMSQYFDENLQLVEGLTLENQQSNIQCIQNLFAEQLLKKGYKEFSKETFGPSLRKAKLSGILDEKLTKIGNYIHQLTEAHTLCLWLSNETFDSIYQQILDFNNDYTKVYGLKKAKIVTHDAHVMNFMLNENAEGKKATQIDMVGSLCSGQRIYDLCTNLRNACLPSNPTIVDLEVAKIMIEQYDNRERLTDQEIESIYTLFKAVEIGNAPHGLAALLGRAAKIHNLGNSDYDSEIIPQFPMDAKKKVIDLDTLRIAQNNFVPLVTQAREKTCDALNLRTSTKTLPVQILSRQGFFAPSPHQQRILATVEISLVEPKFS